MPTSADALWQVYRATSYEASTPGAALRIRVGQREPALEELLASNAASCWCFITAWNPRSQRLPRAENDRRNAVLQRELERLGRGSVIPGIGRPDDPGWEPEESWLALGVDRESAIALGRQFEQNAVVWGERGGPARLLDCRPARSDPAPA
jgi:hypothetical protein